MPGFVARTLILATAALPAVGLADPTDVVQVPTAEVKAPGQASLEVLQDLDYQGSDEDLTTSFLTEFGITDRIEAGIDFNSVSEGDDIEADIKFQLIDPNEDLVGVAVGVFNASTQEDLDEFYYAVGTTHLNGASITAGAGYSDDTDTEALLGATYALTPRFTLLADWISGDSGAVLAGFSYRINDSLSAALWWKDLNDDPREVVQLDLIIGFEVADLLP